MTEAQPFRVPRLLSCLVKGPLGCITFLLGALAVGVLFLPFAAGRLLDRGAEKWFARRFAGSLDLGDAWFGSLYDEQRIDRLILRDPSRDEVLRAAVRAPSLSGPWSGPPYRWGPVELRIEVLRLVQDEDGTTNLEHALRARYDWYDEDERDLRMQADADFRIDLEVVVERLRYSVGRGKEEMLEDMHFQGTLAFGPEETRLVLAGGSLPESPEPFRARLELHRPEFGPRRPWSFSLELDHAPSSLARALCAPARLLAEYAGARLDRLQWSSEGDEVVLRCEDEGARFELLGQEKGGFAVAGEGGALALRLPCANADGRALLATLFPALAGFECLDPAAEGVLHLGEFAWPLDGDRSRLAGVLRADLAPFRARPTPVFAAWSRAAELLEGLTLAPDARLVLGEGEARYEGWRLDSEHGWIQLDGAADLAGGASTITLTGAHGEEAFVPLHLGPPPESEAEPRAAPEPPEAPTPTATQVPGSEG